METAMIQTTEFERTQTTNPREAKLKDIIEKGKSSLRKAFEEIQHEFAIRDDMAVRPTIRYLDLVAYHYFNHPDGLKEFHFVLIIDTDKPPWILTRYKSQRNLAKGLTHHGLFPTNEDIGSLLSKGIGKILEISKGHFGTEAERNFVEDLIVYLDYKIREGERIRTERKQLSFW
jgi:hypothetical protein